MPGSGSDLLTNFSHDCAIDSSGIHLRGVNAWAVEPWMVSRIALYWLSQDRRRLKRINQLIQACLRHAFVGIGSSQSHHPLKLGEGRIGAGQNEVVSHGLGR
jgi:hypothetical protein